MKNTILISLLTLTTLYSTAQDQDTKVINDRNAQKREAQGFHGIEISSGIDLFLSQGNEEAVAVSAENPEDRDRIVARVEGGILHIYIDNINLHWFMHGHRHLKAYVSAKLVDELNAHGGSDVYCRAPSTPRT